jgi:dTDP-4-amino-4,6-dideoxygalactose transaminase
LHKQKPYSGVNATGSFKVTEKLCERVISLPIHTEMEEEQQEYIIDKVLEFINKG